MYDYQLNWKCIFMIISWTGNSFLNYHRSWNLFRLSLIKICLLLLVHANIFVSPQLHTIDGPTGYWITFHTFILVVCSLMGHARVGAVSLYSKCEVINYYGCQSPVGGGRFPRFGATPPTSRHEKGAGEIAAHSIILLENGPHRV